MRSNPTSMTSRATVVRADTAQSQRPTRLSSVLFRAKALAHQASRVLADAFGNVGRCEQVSDKRFSTLIAESRSRLWTDEREQEASFQRGKVENLRRAVQELDGALIEAGLIFSFWKQIGRASKARGFAIGRMLQQGCMIPAVGGGLCQLSNALYDAALQSGCEIVERHSHSRTVPGSAAAFGRDATVAWNYVDLRFRASYPFVIRARVSENELVVSFRAQPGALLRARRLRSEAPIQLSAAGRGVASTCGTCSETRCFRREK
jgi:vancomycin resistance protein YoaR